jgi:hypothetical protein
VIVVAGCVVLDGVSCNDLVPWEDDATFGGMMDVASLL